VNGLPRVGFGTAALGRSLPRAERARVVQTAFDCGLTHYDTAPLYGGGGAEEAIAMLPRDAITIATKAGYRAPSLPRSVAGRLARRPAHAEGGLFAPADVRASLEGSLRRLRTSHVDLFLLHDVRADAVEDALLDELEAIVRRGDARATGVATGWPEAEAILAAATGAFPAVVQAPADPEPPLLPGRTLVLHSAIAGRPGEPGGLLREVVERRPDALVLFGSRDPRHVRETAAAVL
jgi:aryl-alcohol dehydrogenase-like predicted oxidoreductase